jgi:uncharacterized membrane protein
MDIDSNTLLQTTALAIVTGMLLQLLKPALSEHVSKSWYPLIVNVMALVFGITLSVAGLYIAEILQFNVSEDGPVVALAVVRGVIGAFMSVYGWEGYKNIRKAVSGKELDPQGDSTTP